MTTTTRLSLERPLPDDLEALFAIYSDPRVWQHFPSLRHTDPERTAAMLRGWIDGWERDGLGMWMVRLPGDPALLGHGGCTIRADSFWNLGYRFAPAAQGHGYATEVAREAVSAAQQHRPDLPVVAYLLENNLPSANVATKVGLALQHRAPDAGNPDPGAIRLVYADRQLTAEQLAATLR
ncbi:GNAT family N-acetyltransferase [Branchiibius sp. NY16-3462-2]|uniref:GNAT family N-acetyltransferase n=1 Tax=Branchiibius sp. NY16-3462-2 TaxID=1807500 RepID=UPI000792770F|nr:GNAT family N-acetyltransferase [Branchiibius sp. NY16-3462-2]KYH45153.1 GCN5 family acetyltransferase [Branchiibius sp. NY16-3462-2]